MRGALLFDLDGTLVVEEPAAVAAFEATARSAAAVHAVDAGTLALAARSRARELWRAAPTYEYCRRVGISSWEGLWCRFTADDPETRRLRDWAPAYRREAWRLALLDQGVDDPALAEVCGERFGVERRARHERFDDAAAAVRELAGEWALGLVTNGAACLQREKLAASGLDRHFSVVVVSADVGVGKPDGAIFAAALARLGNDTRPAVMVGDSFSRDVEGAIAAGVAAVWLNRTGSRRPAGGPDVVEIRSLRELPAALE